VGTTSTTVGGATSGKGFRVDGANGIVQACASGNVSAIFNRTSDDGDIVSLRKNGTSVGSIGVNSTDNLYFAGGTGSTKGIYLSDGGVVPANAGGAPLDDGANLGHTSYRFKDLYLSGGAYLGGTGSANALDDYEEGTWTPLFGGTTGTPSGSNQGSYGYYTKIGRLVHVTWYLYFTLTSVGSGSLLITGLPFDKSSSAGSSSFGVSVGHYNPYLPNGISPRSYGDDNIGFLGITSANTSWDWASTSYLSTTSANLSHGSMTYFTD